MRLILSEKAVILLADNLVKPRQIDWVLIHEIDADRVTQVISWMSAA